MNTSQLMPMTPEGSLVHYLKTIASFDMLDAQTEFMLAKRYQAHSDLDAAHRLTTSHLRLAAKVALSFRHYGLPVADLISEANIGLMQAIKKFDPDKGFRLSTYALWWIKASISDFILKSWSLVKMGTVAAQKRLFYNLNKVKAKLGLYDAGLDGDMVKKIAKQLGTTEREVVDMDQRLSGDVSLNVSAFDDGDEKMNFLVDGAANIETALIENQETHLKNQNLNKALDLLSDRERAIIRARFLEDESATLEDLGGRFNISRERVRQIESVALSKMKKAMLLAV